MDRVTDLAVPMSSDLHAALFLERTGEDLRHLGILHRTSVDGSVLALHLVWHCDLRNEVAPSKGLCIEPTVPRLRLQQVAARCRQIWDENQNGDVPFGFSNPNGFFDDATGKMLLGPSRHGLTCASFVIAAFKFAGIELVRYDTWPTNQDDDQKWQKHVVTLLKDPRSNASPEHIRSVEGEIGNSRFRPEQVAGAAIVSPLPADYQQAVQNGELIVKELDLALKEPSSIPVPANEGDPEKERQDN